MRHHDRLDAGVTTYHARDIRLWPPVRKTAVRLSGGVMIVRANARMGIAGAERPGCAGKRLQPRQSRRQKRDGQHNFENEAMTPEFHLDLQFDDASVCGDA